MLGETRPASVCTTTLLDCFALGARLRGGLAGADEEAGVGVGTGTGTEAGAGLALGLDG